MVNQKHQFANKICAKNIKIFSDRFYKQQNLCLDILKVPVDDANQQRIDLNAKKYYGVKSFFTHHSYIDLDNYSIPEIRELLSKYLDQHNKTDKYNYYIFPTYWL